MANVLVAGATAAMGRKLAEAFARQGDALYLCARDTDELERIASDLRVRFEVPVQWGAFDATDFDEHAKLLDDATIALGGLDGVALVFGELGDTERAAREASYARWIVDCNYTGAVNLLTLVAQRFEDKGSGFIIGIGSVAGDRGRQSNYVYGSAKGAFHLFLQGLRNRLSSRGVHVLTVKPGFVDSPMTFGKEGLFLVASPEKVARAILRALKRRRNVIYVPWFWRWIMLIICCIPEFIFKRLKL